MSVCSDWILAPSGIKLGWSQLLLNTVLLSKLEPIRDQLQLLLVMFLFHSKQRSTPWWSMHIKINSPFWPCKQSKPSYSYDTHLHSLFGCHDRVEQSFSFPGIFLSQDHFSAFTCTCWQIIDLLKIHPSRFSIFDARYNLVPHIKHFIPTTPTNYSGF